MKRARSFFSGGSEQEPPLRVWLLSGGFAPMPEQTEPDKSGAEKRECRRLGDHQRPGNQREAVRAVISIRDRCFACGGDAVGEIRSAAGIEGGRLGYDL